MKNIFIGIGLIFFGVFDVKSQNFQVNSEELQEVIVKGKKTSYWTLISDCYKNYKSINTNKLNEIFSGFSKIKKNNNDFFEFMGWSNSTKINTLTFCDDESYINEINNNPNITGVIIKPDFKNVFNDKSKKIYINDDPRYVFYTIFNKNAIKNKKEIDTIIHPTASIHPTAYISNVNVIIGENTIIKPNVTILEDVEIGNNCVIQSGTVIGSEGFEFKKTSKGVISVLHDGKVIIKNNVHIGANTCIDKGFSFRDTFIDDNVMIDNLVHVAHCVHIKNGASIIAGKILGGS
jgi:UDP-3-O-[3-hydroxymyristoyl] glucosamine N-acyltransferase